MTHPIIVTVEGVVFVAAGGVCAEEGVLAAGVCAATDAAYESAIPQSSARFIQTSRLPITLQAGRHASAKLLKIRMSNMELVLLHAGAWMHGLPGKPFKPN
ncbi:MAG TPA: hypothetical protein VJP86_08040 [Vicinamibacterales bacterium]|nr:hypothetical protein [Vicinamibacterales bacterium]